MPHGNHPIDASRIRVLGDDLLGVTVADATAGQQLAAQLRETGAWLDVVAGIDSIAVHFDLVAVDLDGARRQLGAQLQTTAPAGDANVALVEIPVCYGGDFGPDLGAVCESLDLSAAQLIDLHAAGKYTVDMLGFTPGFAYVGGLPDELNVPRREQPRQHVAAGSIGIADGRTGVYAMAGPGGWPLIGRTPTTLFAADADEPFLLKAGALVRFQPIDAAQFRKLERS